MTTPHIDELTGWCVLALKDFNEQRSTDTRKLPSKRICDRFALLASLTQ